MTFKPLTDTQAVAAFKELAKFLDAERQAGREAPRLTADRVRTFLGLLPTWRVPEPACGTSGNQEYEELRAEKFKNNAR